MSVRRRLAAAFAVFALVASGLAVLVAPLPAAAAAPTRILNTSTGGGFPSWLETHSMADDGNGRRMTVTFLAEHAPGRHIDEVFVDNGISGNDSTIGVTPQAYPSPSSNGLETSRVTLTFDPGKSGAFDCPWWGGGATRRVSRTMGFRVIDNAGQQSQYVSYGDVMQIEDDDCIGRTDYPEMHGQTQSADTAVPGENVRFTFQADDSDNTGTNDHFDRYRWRMRRLNDGHTTGLTTVNPPGGNDNQTISLDVAFPDRGRWVVEADLGGEDGFGQSGGDFFRLGAVDVNEASSTLDPSLGFSGGGVVAGSPPSVNEGDAADAVLTASDGGAGEVQVAEWDADGNGSFERREYTVPSGGAVSHPGLTTAERTQAVDTSTPGVKTVGARVTDNGALDASDNIRRTRSTTEQIRVNAIPTASDLTTSTPEDTDTTFSLIGDDADDQPASLTYTVLSNPANGDLSCTGNDCTYTPDENFNGTDSFTYEVADGPVADAAWATSNVATATIDVTPVNDAPVADGQELSTDEDTALPVTLTADDVDGDPLDFDIVSGPTHGALSGSDANRTYTPGQDFNGSDSFVFSATDTDGSSGTATVEITVDPVNDAPEPVDQDLNTAEDVPLELSLVATDVDGDDLTFTPGQPSDGTLDCVGTACTYTPDPDFNGTDSFTFDVDDGNGGQATGTITVTVDPVNDAPVASAQAVELDEDVPVDITLDADDVDGDPLSFDVIAGPDHGTTTPVGGPVVNYAPDLDYNGSDEFTFEADDGALSDTAVVALTINPVNDAPDVDDQQFATDEDTATILSIVASDVDGDTLAYSATEPADGELVGTLPDVAYVPDQGFNGTDTFTVTVDDGNGGQTSATVTIAVGPVNNAPVAVATEVTTDEDTPVDVDLTASDADGDELTYTVVEGPDHGVLDCPSDGASCTYTPDDDVTGSDLVVFEVSDGEFTDAASVSITIAPVNDAPEATDVSVTTDEDVPVPVTLHGTDVDGDDLSFTVTSPPSSGTLSGDPPTVLYTPNPDANGSDSFGFEVSDGSTSVSGTVTVDVAPVNDAPVPAPVSVGTPEDTPVSFTLEATDVDDAQSELTFTLEDPEPAEGVVECSGPGGAECEFTPDDDFEGLVQLTYEVSDGEATGSNVVTISVAGLNDAPVADDQQVETDEDTAVPVTLTGSDADDDDLSFSVLSQPSAGTLSGTAPNLLYTPAAESSGTDSFEFTVSDGEQSDTGTVTIEVAPANDAPVAEPQAVDVDEESPTEFQLEATDVDGDELSYEATSAPTHGTVDCDTSGACTYTPDTDFNGADSFTFAAVDPSGAQDEATVTLAVEAGPLEETIIEAEPVILTLQPVFRATLTEAGSGEPLAGRTVRFVATGDERCTAVTDADGVATCGPPLLDLYALLGLGYTAEFEGDDDFASSDDTAQLLLTLRLF